MKKNCEQILESLKNGYLDNELEFAEREEINLHLEGCPTCRRAKENLMAISLVLRNAPRAAPPKNLWPRIQKEIRPISRPRVRPAETFSFVNFKYFFTRKNSFALAAAAALVIAVTGFYLGAGRMDNGETAPSLTAILDNDEIFELDMNFGSAIEKYFL